MSEDQSDTPSIGFAERPGKNEWLGLMRDLLSDLAAIEQSASDMRQRIDMIARRINK